MMTFKRFNSLKIGSFLLFFYTSPISAAQYQVATTQIPNIGHPTATPYEEQNTIQLALFDYLLKRSPKGAWLCNICVKFPSLEQVKNAFEQRSKKNPFLIRLQLKSDLKWSDGVAVSINDVIFSWKVYKRHLTSLNESISPAIIEDITRSTKQNEFIVRLKDFRVDLHSYLQFPLIRESLEESIWFRHIKKGVKNYFSKSRYTTSPRKSGLFLAPKGISNISKNSIEIFLNDTKYHFVECPKLNKCADKIIGGSLDLLVDYDPLESRDDVTKFNSYYSHLQNEKLIGTKIRHVPKLEVLHINTKNPLFLDKELKEYLYNKLHDLEFVYPDTKTSPAKQAEIFFRDKILNKHKNLRIKRPKSHSNRTLELVYLKNKRYRPQLVKTLQEKFGDDKIIIEPKAYSRSDFEKIIIEQNNYRDLLLLSWRLPYNEIPFSLLHSEEVPLINQTMRGQNLSNYANVELDKLINTLLRLEKGKSREEMIAGIIAHVRKSVPLIPLFFHREFLFYNKKRLNVVQYPDNGLPFDLNFIESSKNQG